MPKQEITCTIIDGEISSFVISSIITTYYLSVTVFYEIECNTGIINKKVYLEFSSCFWLLLWAVIINCSDTSQFLFTVSQALFIACMRILHAPEHALSQGTAEGLPGHWGLGWQGLRSSWARTVVGVSRKSRGGQWTLSAYLDISAIKVQLGRSVIYTYLIKCVQKIFTYYIMLYFYPILNYR